MCQYRFTDGGQCQLEPESIGLCFWHDPKQSKDGLELASALEDLARAGHSLEGMQLKRANLQGINLVNHGQKSGFNLQHMDLYRADLTQAHLFMADFRHSSLMKANLELSNLHFADLRHCNLLGTQFKGSRTENVQWGTLINQEAQGRIAKRAGQSTEALDLFEQAEEIYRSLRKQGEQQGLFEQSGQFFYREMRMRREQLPLFSSKRAFSWLVDVFCGYGEKPLRVVSFSLMLIVSMTFLYAIFGITDGEQVLRLSTQASWQDNGLTWLNSLYFSVVTFTTLGYGDFVPLGASRILAASEAFVGSFTLALFVVVFVKKMTR